MRILMILGMTVMLAATSAEAETFACHAATNKAKVGIRSGSEVGITADYRNQECRFSVNGAPVGSPPEKDVMAGLELVRNGDMSRVIQKGDVMPLAMILLSSSSDIEAPQELVSVLKAKAGPLAQCFDDFTANRLEPGKYPIREADVICGALAKQSEQIKLSLGKGVEVASRGDDPILVVAVARQSAKVEHFVFFTRAYIRK